MTSQHLYHIQYQTFEEVDQLVRYLIRVLLFSLGDCYKCARHFSHSKFQLRFVLSI